MARSQPYSKVSDKLTRFSTKKFNLGNVYRLKKTNTFQRYNISYKISLLIGQRHEKLYITSNILTLCFQENTILKGERHENTCTCMQKKLAFMLHFHEFAQMNSFEFTSLKTDTVYRRKQSAKVKQNRHLCCTHERKNTQRFENIITSSLKPKITD